MMITKNRIESPVDVDGRQHSYRSFPLPHSRVNQLAGAIRRFLPSRRDREVPQGMKGGE
jgi:hypothetical protein